jgi:hypothetical protein
MGGEVDCDPLLPNFPRLPQISRILEDGTLYKEVCPYVQPLSITNKLHDDHSQRVYSDWIAKTRLFYNSLSNIEKLFISLYISSYYIEINQYSRKGIESLVKSFKVKEIASTLKNTIYKSPKPADKLYAYRVTNIAWALNESSDVIDKFIPKQFSSFSLNPHIAKHFTKNNNLDLMFCVELGPHVPHLLSISSIDDMESEVLFPPGTEFTLKSIEELSIAPKNKLYILSAAIANSYSPWVNLARFRLFH